MSIKLKIARCSQAMGTVLFVGSIISSSKTYVPEEKAAYTAIGLFGLGMVVGGTYKAALAKRKVEVVK